MKKLSLQYQTSLMTLTQATKIGHSRINLPPPLYHETGLPSTNEKWFVVTLMPQLGCATPQLTHK